MNNAEEKKETSLVKFQNRLKVVDQITHPLELSAIFTTPSCF